MKNKMKKLIVLILAIMVAGSLFTACGKKAADYVGTWTSVSFIVGEDVKDMTGEHDVTTLVLKDDGNFEMTMWQVSYNAEGQESWFKDLQTGTWKTKGKGFSINMYSTTYQFIPYGDGLMAIDNGDAGVMTFAREE